MIKLPLNNSDSLLVEDGGALWIDSPGQPRYPVDTGVISLTSRCNLDCVMCLEPHDEARRTDLALDDALRLVDVFAGRVPKIWTCAGEALLHPQFLEVARRVRERGSRLGVGTNGLVLGSAEMLRRCAEAGVKWLHVSCHTCRPERFAALSGRPAPSLFAAFVRALDNIDTWNRERPEAERLEVLLQVVPMRGFPEELDDWFAFVGAHLGHSPLQIRVEPMQLQASAREHPELALDLDELARVVDRMLRGYADRFALEFKSVPLCLLQGAEGLSEDVKRVARRAFQVGNVSCATTELQLHCPVGDPARSPFAERCAQCALEPLCPGVMDVPVPAGSPWPCPRSTTPEQVLAAAGQAPDYRRREQAPVYPAHDDAVRPPAPAPARAPSGEAASDGPPAPSAEPDRGPGPDADAGGLVAARLDVDLSAGRRFGEKQAAAVRALVAALEAEPGVAESVVEDGWAAVRLACAAILVLQPAPARPRCFDAGGVSVRYNGDMSDALGRALETARRLLRGAGEP